MAVNSKKLEAFANPGGPPPPPEKSAPEKSEDKDEGEMEEGGEGRFGKLIPLLEEFSEDIEASCEELDPESLLNTEADMAPEDKQILDENFKTMDNRLKEELKAVGSISLDDANELADHLGEEDMVEDPEKFAGWLVRVTAEAPSEEEDEESEDSEEESEGDSDEDFEDADYEE